MLGSHIRPRILTVTELAGAIRDVLAEAVGAVWVAGELSSVKRAASGHLYFTIKDELSQLSAVLFRSGAQTLPFEPREGLEVVARARVVVYPPRGALQLTVDHLEPRGLGALRLAFEQLKGRLEAEGLFDAARKRPLPRIPRTVGVVTAVGGAAVRDVITTLRRRWPAARVLVRPVLVQGAGAARDIAAAIGDLGRVRSVDVLIVARGGGSLEDLWAFNEEPVARAIAASRVPVVSGIGHEIDFTIADFVADVRGATPTAAATAVVPERIRLLTEVAGRRDALVVGLERRLRDARRRLAAVGERLASPRRRLDDLRIRLDEHAIRLERSLVGRVNWDRRELAMLARRLEAAGPAAGLARSRARLAMARERLRLGVAALLAAARASLERKEHALGALSPLACLERGYAIVRHGDLDGSVVRDAAALQPGDAVALVLSRGRAYGRVERTETE
jgi:exodeoxyribonuclease VII large subunit